MYWRELWEFSHFQPFSSAHGQNTGLCISLGCTVPHSPCTAQAGGQIGMVHIWIVEYRGSENITLDMPIDFTTQFLHSLAILNTFNQKVTKPFFLPGLKSFRKNSNYLILKMITVNGREWQSLSSCARYSSFNSGSSIVTKLDLSPLCSLTWRY